LSQKNTRLKKYTFKEEWELQEHDFFWFDNYELDSVGWGSPFYWFQKLPQ
jgi:hypothetical protein